MHSLIKFKRTGTPEDFAVRLGISRAKLFRLLGELRELGAPVRFCNRRQSYVYFRSVELQLRFVPTDGSVSEGPAAPGREAIVVPLADRRIAMNS